jgi:ABC-type transporter Mla subunit MlaD
MSRLSFDTNVIQSLSKKVGEINASNNIVTEAIKALNENTFKMSQTLQKTSEMLQRSSANNKDLSQSISTLTQKLAVQNASDNTSSVKKQLASHNVQTTPTNLPTSNR